MKKLSKELLKRKEEVVQGLSKAGEELQAAVSDFNVKLEELKEKLQEKVDAYNVEVQAAEEWRTDVCNAIEEYVGERSERWQESEAADAYNDWLSEYQGIDLDEVELVLLDLPDEIEALDLCLEELEDLRDSVDG